MTSCATRTLGSTSARCSILFNAGCVNSTSRSTVRVSTSSQLPLPSIVSGTDLLAVVPRRLAERSASATGTVAVPTPFESVELIERLWWHPARAHDPAHRWFREEVVAVVERGVLA